MKVKIVSISDDWREDKFTPGKYNLHVITQSIENYNHQGKEINEGTSLKLNVGSDLNNRKDWINALRVGNVLNVDLFEKYNKIGISKYNSPTIIRVAEEGKQAQDFEA